ncbi:MAG: 4-hydroxy-tetrahydrodipicolinate reductase [Chlamydiales bacterium]|nr:4-hydroxy-tetrahydrodipicolinate reductase [Chlamydiales bacterium]
MDFALIGYGKMGRIIEKIAAERGHSVLVKIDPLIDSQNSAAKTLLQDVDACIDFSHPDAVIDHIDLCASVGKPLVIGTTGWYEHLQAAEKKANQANIGVIWSANFSLGINLFMHVVKESAKIFNPFTSYDVAGFEIHHEQKIDSPSGTAKRLAETLLEELTNKKKILYETVNRKVEKEELQFTSLRVGHVPGTHTIYFDSPSDTITLTHTARNRESFAEGAVIAAEWIVGKTGFFTIDDLMNQWNAQ